MWKSFNPHGLIFLLFLPWLYQRDITGKEVVVSMECKMQGCPVTPEMPGVCAGCLLYLDTCLPVIQDGWLSGAECDADYCQYCPHFGECGR